MTAYHQAMEFYQDGPELTNTFHSDPLLKSFLKSTLSPDAFKQTSQHLEHLGNRAVTDLLQFSREAEAEPPVHGPYDPWGRRIDDLKTSVAWKNLEIAAATEGIVATAYERKLGDQSRIYQMALLYLYHPSSAFFSCPLAMTDGAARAIELYGDESLKQNAFRHLTSRDPAKFWTAGQWMTERTGGSDISGTMTTAEPTSEKLNFSATHLLRGTKWFTSATTSQMAMTLARPTGAVEGSRGLSLFYLELRDEKNNLRNIEIHRLKDKLGTKALPTAELSLKGTPAQLVGGMGDGVKKIASLFNVTRVYNSMCALGQMRRALDLAQSYSRKRKAFGKLLIDHPLHALTLKDLETEFAKCFRLCFFVAGLLGKDECGTATENEKLLLRALTPILKLYTAKKNIAICSEVLECFGGAGYIEDTGIPRLLRDAQVLAIWEGTTNVLSLDMLRAFQKENALPAVLEYLKKSNVDMTEMNQLLAEIQKKGAEFQEVSARKMAFLIAELMAASLV